MKLVHVYVPIHVGILCKFLWVHGITTVSLIIATIIVPLVVIFCCCCFFFILVINYLKMESRWCNCWWNLLQRIIFTEFHALSGNIESSVHHSDFGGTIYLESLTTLGESSRGWIMLSKIFWTISLNSLVLLSLCSCCSLCCFLGFILLCNNPKLFHFFLFELLLSQRLVFMKSRGLSTLLVLVVALWCFWFFNCGWWDNCSWWKLRL